MIGAIDQEARACRKPHGEDSVVKGEGMVTLGSRIGLTKHGLLVTC